MVRSLWIALLAVAGCTFRIAPLDPVDGLAPAGSDGAGAPRDLAARDDLTATGPSDLAMPDLLKPFVVSHVGQNYLAATGDLTVSKTIDTGAHKIDGAAPANGVTFGDAMEPGNLAVSILAVHDLTIANGATVKVSGPRPLVIVASGAITVDGILDGSARKGAAGPGGQGMGGVMMAAGTGGDGAHNGQYDDSGGGGGGFGATGGKGGTGGGAAGGAGGAVYPVNDDALAQSVPGGSAGGGGSSNDFGGCPMPTAGAGGGSIQLSAQVQIAFGAMGGVTVGGGGGRGGCINNNAAASGGGGGSGGAIFIESPSVTFDPAAILAANGGGGGSGGDFGNSAGKDGGDGAAAATQAGGGGGVGGQSAAGGKGGALAAPSGDVGGSSNMGGGNGGGGGGGVGRIVVRSRGVAVLPTTVSPTAVLDPSL